ncbi:MAG: DUF4290 domain-containing protein [Chlorobi bacterium]|nr:DUF4290 domain-containing protein [Chlorobiota bacterium]
MMETTQSKAYKEERKDKPGFMEGLTYNVVREPIKVPDIGRIYTELIKQVAKLEDKKLKAKLLQAITESISRKIFKRPINEELLQRIWSDIYYITEGNLDIEPPVEILSPEDRELDPELIPYPEKRPHSTFGHYITAFIEIAKYIEDKRLRDLLAKYLAAYMKFVMRKWHRTEVNNQWINEKLKELSGGVLEIDPNEDLGALFNTDRKNNKKR